MRSILLLVASLCLAIPTLLSAEVNSLKPRMNEFEQANMKLQRAFFREDWQTMQQVSNWIAESKPVYAGFESRMKQVLGGEFKQVERLDAQIKSAAKRLESAATDKNIIYAQTELAILQDACISCHAIYRPAFRQAFGQPTK